MQTFRAAGIIPNILEGLNKFEPTLLVTLDLTITTNSSELSLLSLNIYLYLPLYMSIDELPASHFLLLLRILI